MERLIKNSAVLFGGAILLATLALILGLVTFGPQSGRAQPTAQRPVDTPFATHAAQATLPAHPTALSTLPATPRPYPALDPASVTLLTQDWKVYEHPGFGFHIKYPATFFTQEWKVSGDLLFDLNFVDQKWKDASGGVQGMGIAIYANPDKTPLVEWFQNRSGSFTPEGLPEGTLFVDPTQIEPVVVHYETALKFVNGGVIELPGVLIARGSYMFHIWYGPGPDNLEPIYELMLFTLEFTE